MYPICISSKLCKLIRNFYGRASLNSNDDHGNHDDGDNGFGDDDEGDNHFLLKLILILMINCWKNRNGTDCFKSEIYCKCIKSKKLKWFLQYSLTIRIVSQQDDHRLFVLIILSSDGNVLFLLYLPKETKTIVPMYL